MGAIILNIVAWILSGTIGFYLLSNFIKVFKSGGEGESK